MDEFLDSPGYVFSAIIGAVILFIFLAGYFMYRKEKKGNFKRAKIIEVIAEQNNLSFVHHDLQEHLDAPYTFDEINEKFPHTLNKSVGFLTHASASSKAGNIDYQLLAATTQTNYDTDLDPNSYRSALARPRNHPQKGFQLILKPQSIKLPDFSLIHARALLITGATNDEFFRKYHEFNIIPEAQQIEFDNHFLSDIPKPTEVEIEKHYQILLAKAKEDETLSIDYIDEDQAVKSRNKKALKLAELEKEEAYNTEGRDLVNRIEAMDLPLKALYTEYNVNSEDDDISLTLLKMITPEIEKIIIDQSYYIIEVHNNEIMLSSGFELDQGATAQFLKSSLKIVELLQDQYARQLTLSLVS